MCRNYHGSIIIGIKQMKSICWNNSPQFLQSSPISFLSINDDRDWKSNSSSLVHLLSISTPRHRDDGLWLIRDQSRRVIRRSLGSPICKLPTQPVIATTCLYTRPSVFPPRLPSSCFLLLVMEPSTSQVDANIDRFQSFVNTKQYFQIRIQIDWNTCTSTSRSEKDTLKGWKRILIRNSWQISF